MERHRGHPARDVNALARHADGALKGMPANCDSLSHGVLAAVGFGLTRRLLTGPLADKTMSSLVWSRSFWWCLGRCVRPGLMPGHREPVVYCNRRPSLRPSGPATVRGLLAPRDSGISRTVRYFVHFEGCFSRPFFPAPPSRRRAGRRTAGIG